ncbi:MAG: prepilin-type N-terminal cleavage/methylation domain-containing protein [Candidatus Omnitrophica bacterium]|nr:prepilin-type N-terminal cleavage/methylation domain-containing protein [Candidatus Omnitrophota bacterium]MBU4479184.1 prepilin-type N-terminal cleavage/methylation domain-containing protein [Candidatus Omnitrophota bacterium]MCG2704271.1 prepilin-type N-terminal cleavage/methylation domain-containing protein [Candidatus Omnitrophota bacterium]
MRRGGFTLIELMVVIAIIGILAAALIPSVTKLTDKANAAKMVSVVDSVRTASEAYYMDVGSYALEDSNATGAANHRLAFDFGTAGWSGPYLKTPLSRADNPWKNRVYLIPRTSGAESATGGNGFDLDGSGAVETGDATFWSGGNTLQFFLVPLQVTPIVNSMIDGENETNPYGMGKFERLGTTTAVFYITGGN